MTNVRDESYATGVRETARLLGLDPADLLERPLMDDLTARLRAAVADNVAAGLDAEEVVGVTRQTGTTSTAS